MGFRSINDDLLTHLDFHLTSLVGGGQVGLLGGRHAVARMKIMAKLTKDRICRTFILIIKMLDIGKTMRFFVLFR
jgi:hypothetical protein